MDDERVEKLTKELIKLGCNEKGCEGCYLLQFLVKTREHLYFPIEPKIETSCKEYRKYNDLAKKLVENNYIKIVPNVDFVARASDFINVREKAYKDARKDTATDIFKEVIRLLDEVVPKTREFTTLLWLAGQIKTKYNIEDNIEMNNEDEKVLLEMADIMQIACDDCDGCKYKKYGNICSEVAQADKLVKAGYGKLADAVKDIIGRINSFASYDGATGDGVIRAIKRYAEEVYGVRQEANNDGQDRSCKQ